MHMLLGLALVSAGLFVPTANLRADDRADALAVVDDAIKAHGGADALAKAQSYTRTGSGTVSLFDKDIPITSEQTVSLPDRSRVAIEIDKKMRIVVVLNGDKGWESVGGGPASDMAPVRVKEVADEAYVLWLTTLTPLKKGDYLFKVLPERKVNTKPAVGLAVAAKGRPDVRLYFDKETHLLVKVEREAVVGGGKVDKEYFFDDYKEVDGVKLPTKLTETVNGKKFSENASMAYKLHKPDDAAFGKP